MKNLKKFVALLLAGVMAMVMLTACSGGGTGAEKEQEKEILKGLSSRPEAASLVKKGNGKLQNSDSKLYIETENLLKSKIEFDTDIFGNLLLKHETKGFSFEKGFDPKEKYLTVTVWANYQTAGLVAKVVTEITEQFGKIKDTNNNVKVDTNWANVAVVVKTTEKGSYAAIAIQVLNPAYEGK